MARYSSDYYDFVVNVLAGTFEAIQFGYGDLAGAINIYLAPNVGVIKSEWGSDLGDYESYQLMQYRVVGRTYPTLVRSQSLGGVKVRTSASGSD